MTEEVKDENVTAEATADSAAVETAAAEAAPAADTAGERRAKDHGSLRLSARCEAAANDSASAV